MFKTGDMAVYPAHGVGIIEAIEEKEVSGNRQSFYVLRVTGNGMTIMIPTKNASSIGLRKIVSSDDVEHIFDILRSKEGQPVDFHPWNRRYKEYMEKIKTGSLLEVAVVLKELFILKLEKTLSFGEKRMLDIAKALLVNELSVAMSVAEHVVEEDIKQIFV